MNIIFAPEEIHDPTVLGPSIFLAGPTPRSSEASTWRRGALSMLELVFDGTVFVPEGRTWEFKCSYDEQIEWEEKGLKAATCIMFWVPRELKHMPAFTTNDEWGVWKASGKCVWGNPPWAEKVSYQRYYANKLGVPVTDDLMATINNAVFMARQRWMNKTL